MIAEKTNAEILAMSCDRRYCWYKTISRDEKAKAMKLVDISRCAKISKTLTGGKSYMLGRTGERNHFFGRKHTAESIAKNRLANSGKRHWNWQGGKSFESYGVDFDASLKSQIRERDNYTCQECYQDEKQLRCILDVHHIDYDKGNNHSENLISLCRSCHMKTNFGRGDWVGYFRTRVPRFSKAEAG
jgi:hypothetical protein